VKFGCSKRGPEPTLGNPPAPSATSGLRPASPPPETAGLGVNTARRNRLSLAVLRLASDPRLTTHVAARRLLAHNPLVVCDVGVRGGPPAVWEPLGDQVRLIGFDPDPDEVGRLTASFPAATFLPLALGAHRERRTMYLTSFPAGSGFHRTQELMAGTDNERNVEIVGTTEVDVAPLDSLDLPQIDFLKLDVELAELDVLEGASRQLEGLTGVELEVHFPKRPAEAACFAEVDTFLRSHGFELYDLETYRFARRERPSPRLYDYRDDAGDVIPGPTVEGQILTGDALYFRPLIAAAGWGTLRLLKFACMLELHRLADCAAALLHDTPFQELLRGDERADAIGPNYHLLEELWRRHRDEL
jgi:FkbM family methyltransferase